MSQSYVFPSTLQALSDVSVNPNSGQNGYSLVWDNGLQKWKAALTTVIPAGESGSIQINNGSALGSVTGFSYSGTTFTIPTGTNFRPSANSTIAFQNTTGNNIFSINTTSGQVTGPSFNLARVAFTQGTFSGTYAFKHGLSFTDYSNFSEFLIYVNNGGELAIEKLGAAGRINVVNADLRQNSFQALTDGFSFSPYAFALGGPNNLPGGGGESGIYSPRFGDIAIAGSRATILTSRRTATNVSDAALPQRTYVGADATPTAFLDIASGTASNPSIRIRSGVAPTTPQDGAIWFDGTNLKMQVGGVTKTFQWV